MSDCTKKVLCTNPVDWKTLLLSCFQKSTQQNEDGKYCYYLNVTAQVKTAQDCDLYESALSCTGELSDAMLENLFRQIVVVDDCGDNAINLLGFSITS